MNSFPSSLVIVALFLCAGCRPPGQPTEADIELKPDEVRDFAVLYAQNCAGCHGKDGKGNSALGLANPVYLAIASDDIIRRAAGSGIKNSLMPAFAKSAGGTLTDEQIEILVRDMRGRWANFECNRWRNPSALCRHLGRQRNRGCGCLRNLLRRMSRTGRERHGQGQLNC